MKFSDADLDLSPSQPPLYQRIYAFVRQVPPGQVVTYGQVAEAVGGCSARMVGYAMSALRSGTYPDVPWQRVINRKGEVSIPQTNGGALQRQLLEEEGVEFDARQRVNFQRFGWLGEP